MKVMNETCEGIVTFQGLGFVSVDGMLIPICGRRAIDFGFGGEARWVSGQVRRLKKAMPSFNAVIAGTYRWDDEQTQVFLFQSRDKTLFLQEGYLEDIPLGFDDTLAAAQDIQLNAPFRMRFPGLILTESGFTNTALASDPFALFCRSISGVVAPYNTEIFIPAQ